MQSDQNSHRIPRLPEKPTRSNLLSTKSKSESPQNEYYHGIGTGLKNKYTDNPNTQKL